MNEGGAKASSRSQLERALSKRGLFSRGRAAQAIQAGEVSVNGRILTDPQAWVDWRNDDIRWQGRPGHPGGSLYRYGVMHKPKGVVTTRADELGRSETVYGILPPEAKSLWLFPVGRLDKDSEGLLLFTNDGPWADALTGPQSRTAKVYRVKLATRISESDLMAFQKGMPLDGKPTLPCEAEIQTGSWVVVRLREGKNRQIRRMFHALGYSVKKLIRVSIGPLRLEEDFTAGSFRWLTEAEAASLGKRTGVK